MMLPRLLTVFLVATVANASEIGDKCGTKQPCSGTKFMCGDGLCACEPGFVACGKSRCVDIAGDVNNCGWCNHKCKSGLACNQGVCGGKNAPNEFSVSPVFDTTPGSCGWSEAHPTYSLNSGLLFQTAGTGTPQLVTWADPSTPTQWSPALSPSAAPTQPAKANGTPPFSAGGDQWSTTSGFTGLEYLALRTTDRADCGGSRPPCCVTSLCAAKSPQSNTPLMCGPQPGHHFDVCNCTTKGRTVPAIIAVAPGAIKSASSGGPPLPGAVASAPFGSSDDGPTYAFDPGGSSLWFEAGGGSFALKGLDPTLVLYPKCTGTVDSATCPRVAGNGAWSANGAIDLLAQTPGSPNLKPGTSHDGHSTVIVNPCTHHALVSYIEVENGKPFAVVKSINHAGQIVATWKASAGSADADKGCTTAATSTPFNCKEGNADMCPSQLGQSKACCWSKPPKWNSACPTPSPECASPEPEVRHVPRVQMDIKVVQKPMQSAQCVLLVGWDQLVAPQKASQVVHRATLGSVNVTNEANGNIQIIAQAPDSEASSAIESFNGVPVASRFSDAYGFFWVQRDAAGANESFHALVSTDINFGSPVAVTLSGPMKNLWEGDNMSQMMGGLPGGGLLATWPGRIVATKSCSSSVDGAIITPGVCGGLGQPCCGTKCGGKLFCAGTVCKSTIPGPTNTCPNFNLTTCLKECGTNQKCRCLCNVTAWSCKSPQFGQPPVCDCASDANCDYQQACVDGTCQLSQSAPQLLSPIQPPPEDD